MGSKSTAAVLLDFEKAFDTVWHNVLLQKLMECNIPTYMLKIINSCLKQRTFKVTVHSAPSDPTSTRTPQRVFPREAYWLRCYIFYTQRISGICPGQLILFADDSAITVRGSNLVELRSIVQRCLDVFLIYVADWKIGINPTKTQTIICPHNFKRSLIPPLR